MRQVHETPCLHAPAALQSGEREAAVDLRQLEIIQAIAETGSFTGAGAKLHVSQSAVSRQVLLLEQELGEGVFLRVGRRIRITPAGEALLHLAHRVFQDVKDTVALITDTQQPLLGTVHVVGGMTAALHVFPELLREFRAAHPGVDVRVTAGNDELCARLVRNGTADLGLLTLPVDDPGLVTAPAYEEEMLLVVPRAHSLAHKRRVGIAELRREPFIVYDAGSHVRRLTDEFFGREQIEPRVVMQTENAEVGKAMVRNGLGLAILPCQALASEPRGGPLVCLRIHGADLVRRAGWVYAKASRVPREVQAVLAAFEKVKPRLRLAPPAGVRVLKTAD